MHYIALKQHRDPQQFQEFGGPAGDKKLHGKGDFLQNYRRRRNHKEKKQNWKSDCFEVLLSQKKKNDSRDYDRDGQSLSEGFRRKPPEKEKNQSKRQQEQSPVAGGSRRLYQPFPSFPYKVKAYGRHKEPVRKIGQIDPISDKRL
jgi:hypothetical protein